ncbi:MAG: hypothetical protein ACRDQU_00880 [Pseudonocardiaceae bacterium]
MTQALSQVAAGTQILANAIAMAATGLFVTSNVAAPIAPPAVVVGPPKLFWRGYNSGGDPGTGAWNVYLVVALNQYAPENLMSLVASISEAIENYTPGVVLGAGPGIYPSPQGGLPAYIISAQMDFGAGLALYS